MPTVSGSASTTTRNPRHWQLAILVMANAPEICDESFIFAVRELGCRAVAWPPTCHKWAKFSFDHLVGAGEQSGIRRFLGGDMLREHIYFPIPWIGRHLCPDPVRKREFLASVS